MHWIAFAIGAAMSWGLYGPMMHQGQVKLGSPFRALLCVGAAYFVIGVIVPVIALMSQGQLTRAGWNMDGIIGASAAGALGALGAVCIIYAFRAGGVPAYVMPLVFGGAPIINALYTMWLHPPKVSPNPLLYVGMLMVGVGAAMVLYFKPSA
jgi:hypothetical protein